MIIYKFTDTDNYTRRGKEGEQLWAPGVEVTVEWGEKLCARGCLHAYRDPLLAVFMDPVHGCYLPRAKLWTGEGNVRKDDGTKLGCDKIVISREHEIPKVGTMQQVRFGILATQEVCNSPEWCMWAERWLSGEDRSQDAARFTYNRIDIWATAARATIRAAIRADALMHCPSSAFYATWYAADAAAAAASACSDGAGPKIDLIRIAYRAVLEEGT